MIADYHLHSSFSGDRNTPSEAAVLSALDKGLSLMCFTEHFDPDYPYQDVSMELDVPAYFTELRRLQSLYADRIVICIGAELGLQPHLGDYLRSWLSRCLADGYAFDFLIGSTHLVDRTDPYYPQFWSCRRTEEAVSRYLEVTLENIQAFDDFDVYGHLDYIIRYAPEDERRFSYSAHEEQIDTILRLLIQKGKGIEINTAGYKSGFGEPNPCRAVLKRYRELGGEIITIGADAHTPEYLGFRFGEARELLKDCGFRYFTVFQERKAEFVKL